MATVVDFARYASDGTWTSADAGGITGTTSLYHPEGGTDLVLTVVGSTVVGSTLHVTGTIPGGLKHSGWVFAFDSCVDGSANLGFSFMADWSASALRLTVSVQTNADYPVDVSSGKGACAFISCDTQLPECQFPFTLIQAPSSSVMYKSWSEFKYGTPESSVTTMSAILGLQFDLECEQDIADCPVDFTLGMLKFFQA
jgi:hypothetical protein